MAAIFLFIERLPHHLVAALDCRQRPRHATGLCLHPRYLVTGSRRVATLPSQLKDVKAPRESASLPYSMARKSETDSTAARLEERTHSDERASGNPLLQNS